MNDDLSLVALCAAYIAARDAQMEYREMHGEDAIALTNQTAKTFDAIADYMAPWVRKRDEQATLD